MKKILMAVLLAPTMAMAGTLTCAGTVEKLGLHSSNKILLKLSSMNAPVFICNPEIEWSVSGTGYKTGAETCKTMLSMLMHAKASGLSVGSVWFDGDDVPTGCQSWGNWKSANVRYFMY